MMGKNKKRSWRTGTLLLAAGGLMAACMEGEASMPKEESLSHALSVADAQPLLDKLYDINNVLRIEITMDSNDWKSLAEGKPLIGTECANMAPKGQDKFPQYNATTVRIEGETFLAEPAIFSGVKVRKKSNNGSFSTTKPSLKLEFPDTAEGKLGTKHLTLNNSVQDPDSYVRQTLGYYLLGQAGVPRPRVNYAQVWVNGSKIADGIYINVEPVRKALLANPANGFTHPADGKEGNGVYELAGYDFDDRSLNPDCIGAESASPYKCEMVSGQWVCETGYQADLRVAVAQIKTGISGLSAVVDVDQFIKAYAMEFLLKHNDSYSHGMNNAYFYNDATKDPSPTVAEKSIKFKYIPSGIDQILKPAEYSFRLGTTGVISRLIREDSTTRTKLLNQIKTYRDTLFSRAKISGDIQAYLNKCKANLSALGFDATAGIADVVNQLHLARSASYMLVDPSTTQGLYVVDKATKNVLHPSSAQTVGGTSTDFEVMHQGYADTAGDRWYTNSISSPGFRLVNEATGRRLHCAQSSRTAAGHRYIYATSRSASFNEQSFAITKEIENQDRYAVTGYFRLNCYTGSGVLFGSDDPLADGRQRVYQTGRDQGSRLSLY